MNLAPSRDGSFVPDAYFPVIIMLTVVTIITIIMIIVILIIITAIITVNPIITIINLTSLLTLHLAAKLTICFVLLVAAQLEPS